MTIARLIIPALALYLAAGFLFALAFVRVGVQRTDHAAKDAGLAFRLIIVPGVCALWPLLALRWLRAARPAPPTPAAPASSPDAPTTDWSESETVP